MTETEVIATLANELRKRERFLAKKYPFSDKYLTYWDADDFILKAKIEGLPEVVLYNGKFGIAVQIYGKTIKPGAVVVPPYRVVDAQFMPPAALESLVKAAEVFDGGIVSGLFAAGREEMATYCKKMDDSILEAVMAIGKKHPKVKGIFFKLQKEIGSGDGRLRKRIGYYHELLTAYRQDAAPYKEDVRRLGLSK